MSAAGGVGAAPMSIGIGRFRHSFARKMMAVSATRGKCTSDHDYQAVDPDSDAGHSAGQTAVSCTNPHLTIFILQPHQLGVHSPQTQASSLSQQERVVVGDQEAMAGVPPLPEDLVVPVVQDRATTKTCHPCRTCLVTLGEAA